MSDTKSLLVIVAIVVIFTLCMCGGVTPASNYGCTKKNSYYTLNPSPVNDISGVELADDEYAPVDMDFNNKLDIGCSLGAGVGLSSSLIPQEMASQENLGDFLPDDILKGQNFLDPRNQIGFPETIGGVLRNANQQIRAEPPNPKMAYTFNNSTIVPDLMQRKLC